MKDISTVICELNPMHRGHSYIFEAARKQGGTVVAVMSGNFVQRGECAVYDKYKRARNALSGADLVLELPFPWCAASAEFFAAAGVSIAEAIGSSRLVFGSESGDISAVRRAAEVLESDEYKERFRTASRAGALRGELLGELCPELPESVISSPNDILASEYCRNTKHCEPYAVKRIDTPSASELRETLGGGDAVEGRLSEIEYIYMRTQKSAPSAAECGGGVGERLYKAAFASSDGAHMLEKAATKRYTNARLRRAALFSITGTEMQMLRETPSYTTVLAANERGRAILSDLRRECGISILTNPSDGGKLCGAALLQFRHAAFADSVYTLCLKNKIDSDAFLRMNPEML